MVSASISFRTSSKPRNLPETASNQGGHLEITGSEVLFWEVTCQCSPMLHGLYASLLVCARTLPIHQVHHLQTFKVCTEVMDIFDIPIVRSHLHLYFSTAGVGSPMAGGLRSLSHGVESHDLGIRQNQTNANVDHEYNANY